MTGVDAWNLYGDLSDDDYPSDWHTRRRMVYRRDDYTCQRCGAEGGGDGDVELHAHHIIPKSRGGSHSLNNLTTLCYSCHNAVHDHHIPRQTKSYGSPTSSDDDETETIPMSVESAHYEYMRGNLDDDELEAKIEARMESDLPNKVPSESMDPNTYDEKDEYKDALIGFGVIAYFFVFMMLIPVSMGFALLFLTVGIAIAMWVDPDDT